MKTLNLIIGCTFVIVGLLILNRFLPVEASLPESKIYKQVEYCLPPQKSVDKIKYIASVKYQNLVFYSFYISQKLPIHFQDDIKDVTRRLIIQVDDIGCLIIMPVEKFQDSMTLYLPKTIAFDLLEQELKKEFDRLGGIENYIKKRNKEDSQNQSMDNAGDSGIYMLPEFVEVYRRLGIPLPKFYTIIDSYTQAPEYIPINP